MVILSSLIMCIALSLMRYITHGESWTEKGKTMSKEIRQECERIFEPKSSKGMICPECHRKRLSQYAKARNLNKLGNDAYSKQQSERKFNG